MGASRPALGGQAECGQLAHEFDRGEADVNDLPDEAEDVLRVGGAVRVVDDAAAPVGRDLILIYHPFERRAVAEAILERLCRDAREREELVIDEM